MEGIPYTATDDDVQNFFASCGSIVSLRMPRYQDSGRPRGYAHVEFESKAQADAAIKLSGRRHYPCLLCRLVCGLTISFVVALPQASTFTTAT